VELGPHEPLLRGQHIVFLGITGSRGVKKSFRYHTNRIMDDKNPVKTVNSPSTT